MEKIIKQEIIKIHSSDFYTENNIPSKKLVNAVESYCIDRKDRILALIDSTILGSAKNGMAIGLKGVYWNNDWATDTIKKFLSWSELEAHQIHQDGLRVVLAPGCVFSLAGSSVKSSQVVNLLQSILNHQQSKSSKDIQQDIIKTQDNTENITNQPINSKQENKNPFNGSYEESILRAIQFASKKYRLSQKIYIAPKININTVQTILSSTREKIDPFSIWMVVDNTFFQTGKDFLILTTDYICAKSAFRDFEKFNIEEIREIHSNGVKLYINKYEFQFFDQLEEYEVTILVDALKELVVVLRDIKKRVDTGLDKVIATAFISAYKSFCEEISSDHESTPNKFARKILSKLETSLKIIISSYKEKYFYDDHHFLYQILYVYCVLSAYLLKTSPVSKNANTTGLNILKTVVILSIISFMDQTNENDAFIEDSDFYLGFFNAIFEATEENSTIDDILSMININSEAERKAILYANDLNPKLSAVFFKP